MLKKTNLMFLGTHFQTNNINENYEIYLEGCKLARVEKAKFLGITIDENLTWKKNNNVCKQCARNIGVLNKFERVCLNKHCINCIVQQYCHT